MPQTNKQQAINIVDKIIESAIENNATNIHLELHPQKIIVRQRIDHVLKKIDEYDIKYSQAINNYIKSLAKLNKSSQRPQEGRFKINNQQYKISFRISTLPVSDGEKIVLHINNELTKKTKLSQLDLEKNNLKILKQNIQKSSGIILINGNKHSGKLETFYTLLNELSQTKKKIATIENPVQYKIPHVQQTQVNSKIGYDFSTAVKTLNKSADVIYVEQAKSKKTFDEFFKSVLSGHLILSSLHTSNTQQALKFLNKLKVDSFLLSSNLNLIISQKLLPQICQHCKQEIKLTKKQNQQLKQHFDTPQFKKYLIKNKFIKSAKQPIKFYTAKGCKKCDQTGYQGSIAIYEFFEINETLANLIYKQAPLNKIFKQARKDNFITLEQNAFIKALQGLINLENVLELV